MEDTLQKVFGILIGVIIFFLLPLYIAFEKKDDISYSLALKITTNFVDNVKSKGYITRKMYDDFNSTLAVTGNAYDIKLEHVSKKYYPVIYAYDNNYQNVQAQFDYNTYQEGFRNNEIIKDGITYKNLVLAYDTEKIRYTEKIILDTLDRKEQIIKPIFDGNTNVDYYKSLGYLDLPPVSDMYRTSDNDVIYSMSQGDEFTVIIKNTNTTIASVLFNTLTFGANTGNDTKVYINYGGTIQNEEYRNIVLDDFSIEGVTPEEVVGEE